MEHIFTDLQGPTIIANVSVNPTDDEHLFTVSVEGIRVGSVREEPQGWMSLGAFVFRTHDIPDASRFEGTWSKSNYGSKKGLPPLPHQRPYNTYFESKEEAVRALAVTWVVRLHELHQRRRTDLLTAMNIYTHERSA